MSHLNDLQQKFGDKGFSVVALTSESPGQTEPWVAKHGAEYAYGYDKGGALKRELGIGGIPAAVLLDPSGVVVWEGNPGGLTEKVIEPYLDAALDTPAFAWPEDADDVRKNFSRGKIKKAIDAASRLQDSTYLDSLNAYVEGMVGSIEAAVQSGDYLTASEAAKRAKKELSGLDAAKRADEIARSIQSDKEATKVMKGQMAVRKLRETPLHTKKHVAELLEKVEKLVQKYEGTAASRDAEAFAEELRAKLG